MSGVRVTSGIAREVTMNGSRLCLTKVKCRTTTVSSRLMVILTMKLLRVSTREQFVVRSIVMFME